jgi:hypothetical protein
MPGDYSRKIFRPKKHYSGVLMQQGRVQLDSDWNEQLDIANYRTEIEAIDVIGQTGVPKKNDGFKIGVSGQDLTIANGRIYVEGLLCESEDNASYTKQPYLPNPEFTSPGSPPNSVLNLSDGVYLAYLDAWQREITPIDDALIREVALGGPDTTTRLQNIWQVKLLQVGTLSPPTVVTCDTNIPAFDELTAPTTGKLNAQTQPPKPEDNPCLLPPQTGYTRLENQLYRVEIQKGGPRNQVTFKWSRDNASVETRITNISNKVLTVAGTGKDQILNFAGDQWVEIVDEESTLKGTTRALFRIDTVDHDSNTITLKTSASTLANLKEKKLRRWDQNDTNNANADGVAATGDWIELENGIQIQFSDDKYHAGDYWLIPARTATGEIEWPPYEIPNSHPIPQPPRGIRHHFCRLALVRKQGNNLEVIEDCRKQFPPLTDICAEDICFDNEACDFAGAETVQDALNRLCEARDLRFHNKHLHGWGIVCGLQVECGAATGVLVRPGYAITCEGEDVKLDGTRNVNLLDLLPQGTALTDGELSLILEPHVTGNRQFRVEPFKPPKSKLDALLKGTIWQDVIEDCLMSLISFVKSEFVAKPGEEKQLVGPTQKRISTFTNLLIQLVNKQNGSHVYLSGAEKTPQAEKELRTEDAILRAFYNRLRQLLQSKTFCAMFENARPFPEFPPVYIPMKIATIFNKNFHKRFRVSPNGAIGYSVGAGTKIHVFDLEKNEMAAEIEFPGGPTAIVQDVAFSKDGKLLYAAATIKPHESIFAVADVGSNFQYKWREPAMVCDIEITSLGTLSSSTNVFAIGKGQGLYEINPANVGTKPDPLYQFNAIGHLEIQDDAALAFATATESASAPLYDRVLQLNLKTRVTPPPAYVPTVQGTPLKGGDDIAILTGDKNRLYMVVNAPPGLTNKHVAIFELNKFQPPSAVVDVKETTGIRLAANPVTRNLMLAFDDSYRVGLIGPNNTFENKYWPVQISPSSITASAARKRVYVLNYTSNTISAIPAELFDPAKEFPLQPLVDYRAGVLNAFADLLGGLLQYLKDCFCDHLLVNCPTCDPETDKLYLACITIKNGKVFKVCNFSMRKYVHSFPTVEYWLSIVPIIPAIKMAFEKFCCSVLPGFFGRFQAFKPEPSTGFAPAGSNTVKSEHIRSGVTFAQQANFRTAISQMLTTTAPGRKLTADALMNFANQTFRRQEPDPAVHRGDVLDKPTDQAVETLTKNQIVVEKVEPYDPNKAGRNLIRFSTAPTNLKPGTRLNLVTKDDKVMFYTLADESTANLEELGKDFENVRTTAVETKRALDEALPSLRSAVEASRKSADESREALQKISPQVEEMRANIEKTLPRLESLAAKVDKPSPQLEDLQTKLEAARTELAENKAAVAEALTLRTEISTLRQELLQVRQTHQQELASRDKDIIDLKANLANSRTLLDNINERVKKLPPQG